MTRKYVIAYTGWLAGVTTMAAVAIAWYRHVEGIGMRALADRLASREDATEGTEATYVAPDASYRNAGGLDNEPSA